jgi:hypothetical protein
MSRKVTIEEGSFAAIFTFQWARRRDEHAADNGVRAGRERR